MRMVWQQGGAPVYAALHGRQSADAVIVGGGFSGLHTALWLAKAGLRVVVLEAETLGCGASARCAGLACVTVGTRAARLERAMGKEAAGAYARTQLAALQSLRELACEADMRSDWRDVDAYIVARARAETKRLRAEADALRRAGIAATLTNATQCPLPCKEALCLRDQGTIDPLAHLRSVVTRAERLGVRFFEHSRVTSLESNLASTERGSVLAPYIVVTTGFPIISIPGWYFLRLSQRQCGLFPLASGEPFEGAYLGCDEGYALRSVERGALLAVYGDRVGSRGSIIGRYQRLYAPSFHARVNASVHEGCEVYSASGLPFVGTYGHRTASLFVACGYGGCGLVGSVAAAQIISAKVLGLSVPDYEVYSGRRAAPRFLLDDARSTAVQLGQYAAGLLHPRAPRCPHMGCKLVYRSDTRCWECPCHGSRFDTIGRVLNAPAVDDALLRRDGDR